MEKDVFDTMYYGIRPTQGEYWLESDDGSKACFLVNDAFGDSLHCSRGPAMIMKSGTKAWYQYDDLHREDGPAHELADGTKKWYIRGRLHRLDGPAIEFSNGTKHWYQNHLMHRLDGPAFEHHDGRTEYWIRGEQYTEEEFKAAVKKLNQTQHATAAAVANTTVQECPKETTTKISDTKKLYSVVRNTDLTEGCSYPVCINICELQSTAVRLSAGKGIHGAPADVVEHEVLVKDGVEYIPVSAVPIVKPSEADIQEDSKKKVASRLRALIDKMKADGYTQEDIDLLAQVSQFTA